MKEELNAIGFDEKETEIYLALLKNEKANVSKLLKHTQIERRTIYDVLERLIQKGRASFHEENGTRFYHAISPEILLEDLNQKQQDFQKIIPQLENLQEFPKQATVEVLKGLQGLRMMFLDVIKSGEEHYSFGNITPLIEEKRYARIVNQFLEEMAKRKMTEKILYTKGDSITKKKGSQYREVEKNEVAPTPTLVYGDVVTMYLYTEPMTIFRIRSKELATTYKQYFNHFWKLAKKNQIFSGN